MADRMDFIDRKPGKITVENTRNKYGVGLKTGATLRRNGQIERQGKAHRNNSLLLKHVSMPEGWSENDVENNLNFDDKGLRQFGGNRRGGKRSKSLRSSAVQQSNDGEKAPVFIAYSLNKRNRWLLPESLKQEIQNQKHGQESVVDLTLVERDITQEFRTNQFCRRPDTVAVASTTLAEKDYFQKTKAQKGRRKIYAWADDMLGKSSKNSHSKTEIVKPEITYEVFRPRMKGPHSTSPLKNNASVLKKQKNVRHKERLQKKSHAKKADMSDCDYDTCDALLRHRLREVQIA